MVASRSRMDAALGLFVIGASLALGLCWWNSSEGRELRRRLAGTRPKLAVPRPTPVVDAGSTRRTLFDSINDGVREGVRDAVHEQLGPTLDGLENAIENTLRGHGRKLDRALDPLRKEPASPELEEEQRRLDEERRQW